MHVWWPRAQRRERQRRGERRDRQRVLADPQLGGGVRVGNRVPDARGREPERLRERADDDDAAQPDGGVARGLGIRLVHDQRPSSRHRPERARRVVRPAAERDDGVVVADLGSCEPGGDPEERVRGLVEHAHSVPRTREGSRAEQDQIVGARAEDDLLDADACVRRDRVEQRGETAVRIALDLLQRSRDRFRPRVRRRTRRRVPVEAQHLPRLDSRDPRGFRGRHRPAVGREARRQSAHARSIAAATGRGRRGGLDPGSRVSACEREPQRRPRFARASRSQRVRERLDDGVLRQEADGSACDRPLRISRFGRPRHDHDAHERELADDALRRLEAVQGRHVDVHHDCVRPKRVGEHHRLGAVPGATDDDKPKVHSENGGERLRVSVVVVGDEDAMGASCVGSVHDKSFRSTEAADWRPGRGPKTCTGAKTPHSREAVPPITTGVAAVASPVSDPAAERAALLYEQHHGAIIGYCAWRLRRRDDAEEAAQTTFTRARGALRRGQLPRNERAWLVTIARNVCTTLGTVPHRAREIAGDIPDGVARETDHGLAPEIEVALAALPEGQRRALLLREWPDLSYPKVAAAAALATAVVATEQAVVPQRSAKQLPPAAPTRVARDSTPVAAVTSGSRRTPPTQLRRTVPAHARTSVPTLSGQRRSEGDAAAVGLVPQAAEPKPTPKHDTEPAVTAAQEQPPVSALPTVQAPELPTPAPTLPQVETPSLPDLPVPPPPPLPSLPTTGDLPIDPPKLH